MLAGALAGTTQVIATNPMETVKIQMQMATASFRQASIATLQQVPTTFSVVKELGLKGLYRGSFATLSRDVPFSMIFFQLFALFKEKSGANRHESSHHFPLIFGSGIAAGALSAFLVTPIDGK